MSILFKTLRWTMALHQYSLTFLDFPCPYFGISSSLSGEWFSPGTAISFFVLFMSVCIWKMIGMQGESLCSAHSLIMKPCRVEHTFTTRVRDTCISAISGHAWLAADCQGAATDGSYTQQTGTVSSLQYIRLCIRRARHYFLISVDSLEIWGDNVLLCPCFRHDSWS